MSECIEDGVRCGLARAFKHSDKPDEEWIVETIAREVLNQIDAYWIYDDDQPTTY